MPVRTHPRMGQALQPMREEVMSRDYVQRLRDEAAAKEPKTDTPRTDAYQDSIYEAEIIKHPLREFKAAMGFAASLEKELRHDGPNDAQDTKRLDYIGRTLHIDGTGCTPIYAMFIPGTEGVKSKSDLRGLIDESMKMVENEYLLPATSHRSPEPKPAPNCPDDEEDQSRL